MATHPRLISESEFRAREPDFLIEQALNYNVRQTAAGYRMTFGKIEGPQRAVFVALILFMLGLGTWGGIAKPSLSPFIVGAVLFFISATAFTIYRSAQFRHIQILFHSGGVEIRNGTTTENYTNVADILVHSYYRDRAGKDDPEGFSELYVRLAGDSAGLLYPLARENNIGILDGIAQSAARAMGVPRVYAAREPSRTA